MSEELKRAIYSFINNGKIRHYGSDIDFHNINKYLNAGILALEEPDAFCKYDNKILIIEHFEFDSSENSSKGSKNRREIARIDRASSSNTGKSHHDSIICNYSIENYIKNSEKQFKAHYSKIEKYKQNLKDKNIIKKDTIVEVAFMIEDTTTLGNMDIKTRGLVQLVHCDKFLDLFEQSKQVDYILSLSSFGMDNFTWLLGRNNFDDFRKNQFNSSEVQIADFKPQVLTSSIIIEKN